MSLGPGKYDEVCARVLKETNAVGVVVLVINGKRGSGFSVKGARAIDAMLPELLRQMAADIEAERKSRRN